MSRASSAFLPSSQMNDRTLRLGRTVSAKAKIKLTIANLFPGHAARDVGGDVFSAGVGIANRVANNKLGARRYSLFFVSRFRQAGATTSRASSSVNCKLPSALA